MDLGEEYSISPSLFMELGISQPSPFAIHNNKNSALCFRDVKCTMNFASFLKPFSSIKTQKNPTTQVILLYSLVLNERAVFLMIIFV